MLLGFERLRGTAVTIGIRSYLGNLLSIPSLPACWRHSRVCAMIAEQFAHSSLVRRDDVYTAGVLHDIGRIVLAIVHPKRYTEFIESAAQQPCDVLASERELFGLDHMTLAGNSSPVGICRKSSSRSQPTTTIANGVLN